MAESYALNPEALAEAFVAVWIDDPRRGRGATALKEVLRLMELSREQSPAYRATANLSDADLALCAARPEVLAAALDAVKAFAEWHRQDTQAVAEPSLSKSRGIYRQQDELRDAQYAAMDRAAAGLEAEARTTTVACAECGKQHEATWNAAKDRYTFCCPGAVSEADR